MSDKLKSLSRAQQIKLRQANIATDRDLADVLTDANSRPRIQELLELEKPEMAQLVAELEDRGHDTSLREPMERPSLGVRPEMADSIPSMTQSEPAVADPEPAAAEPVPSDGDSDEQ